MAAAHEDARAARSANDTGNNPHNPMFRINRAGRTANYMALHDDLGRFEEVILTPGLGHGTEFAAVIGFQPIRGMGMG